MTDTNMRTLINLLEATQTDNELPSDIDFSTLKIKGDLAQTFVTLLAVIHTLGSWGSSREVTISVDGDGADSLNLKGLELTKEQAAQLDEATGSGKGIYVSYGNISTMGKE